jgi:hypothetical protein
MRSLLLSALLLSVAHADEPAFVNEEVVIRGDYFYAAKVAYDDFRQKLFDRMTYSGPTPPTPEQMQYAQYASTIDNYNIKVAAGPAQYVVWINPRLSREHPAIFGGAATYIIDASTFKITEKHYLK